MTIRWANRGPRLARQLAAAAVAVVSVFASGGARAQCTPPVPAVLWSSPAVDETDVPVDSDLLIITESSLFGPGGTERQVTLSGPGGAETLLQDAAFAGHYALDELAPNTGYSVSVLLAGEGEPIVFEFTTGERRIGMESGALRITSITEGPIPQGIDPPGVCTAVLYAGDCYDTGPLSLQTFEMAADVPDDVVPFALSSLWLIETVYPSAVNRWKPWPAYCGTAKQLGRYSSEGVSYRVYNVGPSGSVRMSDTVRGPSSLLEEPPVTDSSAGCSLSTRRGANRFPLHLPVGLTVASLALLLGRRVAGAAPNTLAAKPRDSSVKRSASQLVPTDLARASSERRSRAACSRCSSEWPSRAISWNSSALAASVIARTSSTKSRIRSLASSRRAAPWAPWASTSDDENSTRAASTSLAFVPRAPNLCMCSECRAMRA
jgi:hypothetical protein